MNPHPCSAIAAPTAGLAAQPLDRPGLFSRKRLLAFVFLAGLAGTVSAATVTLTNSDAYGASSFNTAGQWSNHAAPASGNDYTVTGLLLRTPTNGSSYTFGGSSLTLNSAGQLAYKGGVSGANAAITVNSLTLGSGLVENLASTVDAPAQNFSFITAGHITLGSGGGIFAVQPYNYGDGNMNQKDITVSAGISGAGGLTVENLTTAGLLVEGTVTLKGTNSYTGGTLVDDWTRLTVAANSSLGTGGTVNVSGAYSQLELDNQAALGLTQTLFLNSGLAAGAIDLNFSGTDAIAGLSLDGGTTRAAAGTYGADGSGADFTSSLFSGAGELLVPAVASYPLPACYAASSQLSLTANTTNVPVVDCSTTLVNYDYCEFSMAGAVSVVVTASQTITNFSISPVNAGITGTASGNTLTFTLPSPQYLILKINNLRNLVVAADALETNAPPSSGTGIYNVTSTPYNADKTGATLATTAIQSAINDAAAARGIVYVPAGVYLCGNLHLTNNSSLYLAGGSVIRGTGNPTNYVTDYLTGTNNATWFVSTAFKSTNVLLYGRGTIDGNGHYMRNTYKYYNSLVDPIGCTNFTMDGIILRDSGDWGFTPIRSANVTVRNTKHFNNNDLDYEDDAVDVEESQNVTVTHTVAVSEDDTYSVKTWDKYIEMATNWPGNPQPASDVTFNNCFSWSRCCAFKIGQGIYQPISNVTFENSSVFRCMYAVGLVHITDSLSGIEANGITYTNLNVEGFWPRSGVLGRWLDIELDITGPVTNVVVAGVNVLSSDQTASELEGYSSYSSVGGVHFNNDYYNGAHGTSLPALDITETNTYLSNVTFQ
jgi:hypothetical protein